MINLSFGWSGTNMPYIKKEDKEFVLFNGPSNAGQLNFMITTVLYDYLKNDKLSYQRINDCLGALEGAKLELYRRVAVPYEEKKIKENGDVYDSDF